MLVTVPLFSWVLWRKTTAALAGEDSARAHVLIRLRGWWLIRVLVLLVFIQIRLLGFRLLMVVGVGDSSLAVLAHWNVLLVRIAVTLATILATIFDIGFGLSLSIHFSYVGIIVIEISDANITLLFLESRITSIPIHDKPLFLLVSLLIISPAFKHPMCSCLKQILFPDIILNANMIP